MRVRARVRHSAERVNFQFGGGGGCRHCGAYGTLLYLLVGAAVGSFVFGEAGAVQHCASPHCPFVQSLAACAELGVHPVPWHVYVSHFGVVETTSQHVA